MGICPLLGITQADSDALPVGLGHFLFYCSKISPWMHLDSSAVSVQVHAILTFKGYPSV
jgi:Na+-translocating ferredoxin:NAD+ oxidoreductase RnfE subunit